MYKISAENKLFNGLKILKKITKKSDLYIYNVVLNMYNILKGNYCDNNFWLADCYNCFNEIFEYCNLNQLERGYIFSKLMDHNYCIVYSNPYSYIRSDLYCDDFNCFGVSYDEIPQILFDYIQKKDNYSFSPVYLDRLEKVLSNFFHRDLKYFSLSNAVKLNSDDNSKLFEEKVLKIRHIVSLLNKNEKSIRIALQKDSELVKLIKSLNNFFSISSSQLENIFVSYIIDGNLNNYRQSLDQTFKKFLESVLEKEEIVRLEQVKLFDSICKFSNNSKRDILDYQNVISLMLLHIPKSLVEDFIVYYMEVDTKEVKQEDVISKKQLKKELLNYYNESDPVSFDFHNLSNLVSLLQKLQYADNVLVNIFNGIIQNAVLNDAYYAYLLEKKSSLNDQSPLFSDIKVSLELLCYCKTLDEWQEYYQYIISLCSNMGVEAFNFDYEMQLVYSKHKK